MTREERNNSIKVLKNFDLNNPNVNSLLFSAEEITNAFDMAIHVLEQAPCDDAISRTDLIRKLQAWDAKANGIPNYAWSIIKELPSVTPKEKALEQEPKTGHWIGHREHCENLGVIPSGLGAYEWCSNCDCGIDVREWHRNHYNYCPNCGCRMESET